MVRHVEDAVYIVKDSAENPVAVRGLSVCGFCLKRLLAHYDSLAVVLAKEDSRVAQLDIDCEVCAASQEEAQAYISQLSNGNYVGWSNIITMLRRIKSVDPKFGLLKRAGLKQV